MDVPGTKEIMLDDIVTKRLIKPYERGELDTSKALGERIREVRRALRVPMTELAFMAELTMVTMSHIETGKPATRGPHSSSIQRIFRSLLDVQKKRHKGEPVGAELENS